MTSRVEREEAFSGRPREDLHLSEPASRETAAPRKRESVPARLVVHRPRPRRLLDFGCGLSRDVAFFREHGIDAIGYDPYYHPRNLEGWSGGFEMVTCTYVLNTLPPFLRARVMDQIKRLLSSGGRLVLSVRTLSDVERERRPDWRPDEDGWRTHRGTFQKGFTLAGLLALLDEEGFVDPVILRKGHGLTVEAVWQPRPQNGENG